MQNQATWDMGMDMDWEVSALELVSTPLDQFVSPDLPRVLVREVLMLGQVITHRTTGLLLSPPMDTPLAMDAVVSAALSLDISVLGMGMDTALEVSAEGLVFTLLDLFMSQDLPKDLASAVLSPATLVMVLPPGYAIGGVSTGVGLHSTGSVYETRYAQGLGKRSADAEPGYYTQNYWPSVVTPYGYSTCYGCRGKRSAEPGYLGLGYGYGYGIGGVSRGVGLHPTGSSMSPDQHRVSVVDTCTRLLL